MVSQQPQNSAHVDNYLITGGPTGVMDCDRAVCSNMQTNALQTVLLGSIVHGMNHTVVTARIYERVGSFSLVNTVVRTADVVGDRLQHSCANPYLLHEQ